MCNVRMYSIIGFERHAEIFMSKVTDNAKCNPEQCGFRNYYGGWRTSEVAGRVTVARPEALIRGLRVKSRCGLAFIEVRSSSSTNRQPQFFCPIPRPAPSFFSSSRCHSRLVGGLRLGCLSP